MERKNLSLDGSWDFWPDPLHDYAHDRLPYDALPIQVPIPWQAQYPALRHHIHTAWYRQTLFLTADWVSNGRLFLHVGAADDTADIWWNGNYIGTHEGGYLPFALEITAAARAGENIVTIRVTDPPEIFPEIPHGKQSWYGMLSGLWQPVRLEQRPNRHLLRASIQTARNCDLTVTVSASAPLQTGEKLLLELTDPEGQVCLVERAPGLTLAANVPAARLWDVGQPNLYTARLTWLDQDGNPIDCLEERFGFRTIERRGGQILLNERPLYVRAALDQDYYPHTLSTPPSIEFLRQQFQRALEMGLNMLRIHIKVGDPRYYQAADEVGLLLWTELPNFEILTEQSQERARATLAGMVARDGNHPSIVMWTIINESWGVDLTNPEHRAWLAQTYHWLKTLDPSRLVVGNSACAGNAHVVTDIADFHNYYAMPDHADQFAAWVETYAARPDWLFCPVYPGAAEWQAILNDPWRTGRDLLPAPESEPRGDEPLLVSEFGNWGLPDIEALKAGYGGQEPWWFETGDAFGEGVVYPHGVEQRFTDLHLSRSFADLPAFCRAHQRLQFDGLQREIQLIRRHRSIQGYVITEFTDVHWECNGLLDIHRNPKSYDADLPGLNAGDLIVTETERSASWSGEEAWVRLYLSHYAPGILEDCTLTWQLEGFDSIHGQQAGLRFDPYTVTPLGGLRLVIPPVSKPARASLHLRLLHPSGVEAAHGAVELGIFPARQPLLDDLRVWVPEQYPELQAAVIALGGRIVPLPQAVVAVAPLWTDELRQYVQQGGQTLWLAECSETQHSVLQHARLVDRAATPWQGDWASTVGWIHRDRLFGDLPTNGLVDFLFEGLTPNAVITGFPQRMFRHEVIAGLAVGWLHRGAATIYQQRLGRGRLTICTFRLKDHAQTHPVAAYLLAELIRCNDPGA